MGAACQVHLVQFWVGWVGETWRRDERQIAGSLCSAKHSSPGIRSLKTEQIESATQSLNCERRLEKGAYIQGRLLWGSFLMNFTSEARYMTELKKIYFACLMYSVFSLFLLRNLKVARRVPYLWVFIFQFFLYFVYLRIWDLYFAYFRILFFSSKF